MLQRLVSSIRPQQKAVSCKSFSALAAPQLHRQPPLLGLLLSEPRRLGLALTPMTPSSPTTLSKARKSSVQAPCISSVCDIGHILPVPEISEICVLAANTSATRPNRLHSRPAAVL